MPFVHDCVLLGHAHRQTYSGTEIAPLDVERKGDFMTFRIVPNTLTAVTLSLGLAGLAASCASTPAQTEVDHELATENAPRSQGEASAKTRQTILESRHLSQAQKESLLDLQKRMGGEAALLRDERAKLRSLLVKEMIRSDFSEDRVAAIKSRISTAENRRVALLFDAIDQANKILGHRSAKNEVIMRSFESEAYGGGN